MDRESKSVGTRDLYIVDDRHGCLLQSLPQSLQIAYSEGWMGLCLRSVVLFHPQMQLLVAAAIPCATPFPQHCRLGNLGKSQHLAIECFCAALPRNAAP